ncbi:MAG: hypothetical protein HQ503_11880 [Rhodospirillales bacterium]|nr:hypothetical protein [Rhodospirillales bacterium]
MKIPLEVQDEVNLIKKSVELDPEKLHSYLDDMVGNWPTEFPKPAPD